jgi:hypothetical protein
LGTSGGCLADVVAAYSSASGAVLSDYSAGACPGSAAAWAATQQALYLRTPGGGAVGFTAGFQARAKLSAGAETPAVDIWLDLGALIYAIDTAAETVQRVFGMSTVAAAAAGDNPAQFWPYDRLGTWLLLSIASPNTVFSGTAPATPSVTPAASVSASPAQTASVTNGASASVTSAATQTLTPTQTPVVVITLTVTVSVPAGAAGQAFSPGVIGNLTQGLATALGVPATWISIIRAQARQLRALAASSSVVWLVVITPPATGSAQTLGLIASLNTAVAGLTAGTLAPALTAAFTAMATAAGTTYSASDYGVTTLGITNNAPAASPSPAASPAPVGAIVGGVVGGAAFVAIVVAAAVFFIHRRRVADAAAKAAAAAPTATAAAPAAAGDTQKPVDAATNVSVVPSAVAELPAITAPVAGINADSDPSPSAEAPVAEPGNVLPAHVAAAVAFRPTPA